MPELGLSGTKFTGYNGLVGLRGVKRPLQPGGEVTDGRAMHTRHEYARKTGTCWHDGLLGAHVRDHTY